MSPVLSVRRSVGQRPALPPLLKCPRAPVLPISVLPSQASTTEGHLSTTTLPGPSGIGAFFSESVPGQARGTPSRQYRGTDSAVGTLKGGNRSLHGHGFAPEARVLFSQPQASGTGVVATLCPDFWLAICLFLTTRSAHGFRATKVQLDTGGRALSERPGRPLQALTDRRMHSQVPFAGALHSRPT